MGVARNFFGGNTFSKNSQKILKNFQKYSKNIQTISKIFKKILKNFKKFQKIIIRKVLKVHNFSRVFSQFNKARGQFLRVWAKNSNCRKFLRKFSKVFLRKLWTCIILADFSQNLRNYSLIFGGLARKRQIIGNLEKILQNFEKFSSKNC